MSAIFLGLMAVFYFLFGSHIAAYLASRATIFLIPPAGDAVEIKGRVRDTVLSYRFAGEDCKADIGPMTLRRLRRKLKVSTVVFLDMTSGQAFAFENTEPLAPKLHAGRIGSMAKTLGGIALRRTASGPFSELAPYIPLMMILMLCMVAAVLAGTGKSQGWW